jgi:Cu-processing system ATP-binding protein
MPVRIRVLLAEAAQRAVNDRGRADPWEGWRRTGERMLELACEETDKVEAIRSLAHLPGVIDDIEIQQPTLDDLYARFLVRSEAER